MWEQGSQGWLVPLGCRFPLRVLNLRKSLRPDKPIRYSVTLSHEFEVTSLRHPFCPCLDMRGPGLVLYICSMCDSAICARYVRAYSATLAHDEQF